MTAVLAVVSPGLRHRLKVLYERLPGFGRGTSYASGGEDAFLQGYFKGKALFSNAAEAMIPRYLQGRVASGFYVDVGAHAPVFLSNTYWFYRRGWRGINIDAGPGSMTAFNRIRPRDVNVEALVSDRETELTFYHWDTPCSTNTLSPEYARYMARRYGREPKMIVMPARRLDSILAKHLPPNQEISFMTVDVEGHDLSVLRSNDWVRFRPELVLVEDWELSASDLAASGIYQFMASMGYEMYSWLRPTVVYRQVGLVDWAVPQMHLPVP